MSFFVYRHNAKAVIKNLILSDREITTDELQERLKRMGITPSRDVIGHIRSEFLHSLQVIRKAGLLRKRDPKVPDYPDPDDPEPIKPNKKRPRTWWPD